jgi:hypothetical protein
MYICICFLDPEEILPEIFFTFIESLTQRLQSYVTDNEELILDKQYMLDALEDEISKYIFQLKNSNVSFF